jgi:hypothetical protein
MEPIISIRTDLFEHREVKPDFINPCCFGEDFAAWLKQKLDGLHSRGFTFSDSLQEDYGWGFWASHGKDKFWIALSYVGDGPQEEPAEWVITVCPPNVVSRLLRGKDSQAAWNELHRRVSEALEADNGIEVLRTPR